MIGKTNKRADNLSRMKIDTFKNLCPEAKPKPDPVHEDFWPIDKVWSKIRWEQRQKAASWELNVKNKNKTD